MSRVIVIARKDCWYDGRIRRAGSSFNADPEHARILSLIGQVRYPKDDPSTSTYERRDLVADDPAMKPKRTYRGRALTVDD